MSSSMQALKFRNCIYFIILPRYSKVVIYEIMINVASFTPEIMGSRGDKKKKSVSAMPIKKRPRNYV